MAYQIADRQLTGNIYRTSRKCGKSNCHCTTNKKYWHPMYYLQYSERDKRHHIYVAKKNVKSLRAKIKYAKAKDKLRKKNYNLFISKIIPIIKRLENNPFDDLTWQSLSQLKSDIPSLAKLVVTFHQQITLLMTLARLSDVINQYFNLISAEEELLIKDYQELLDQI